MIVVVIVGLFLFSVSLGFALGWYVRGAYLGGPKSKDNPKSEHVFAATEPVDTDTSFNKR